MQIRFERNRISTFVIMYSLYLYFLGLSLRNTSKALTIFKDEKRSYVSVWNWIQRFAEYPIYKRKKSICLSNRWNKHPGLAVSIFGYGFVGTIDKSVLGIYIFRRKKHACCWKIHWISCWELWKTYCIFWWRYMVWWSLQCFEVKKLSTFSIREEFW